MHLRRRWDSTGEGEGAPERRPRVEVHRRGNGGSGWERMHLKGIKEAERVWARDGASERGLGARDRDSEGEEKWGRKHTERAWAAVG